MASVMFKFVKSPVMRDGSFLPTELRLEEEYQLASPFDEPSMPFVRFCGPMIQRRKDNFLIRQYTLDRFGLTTKVADTYEQAIQIACNMLREEIEKYLKAIASFCDIAVIDNHVQFEVPIQINSIQFAKKSE